MFTFNSKLEQEFENAIQAIPQEQRLELESEKMKKARIWTIILTTMTGIFSVVNFKKGLFEIYNFIAV